MSERRESNTELPYETHCLVENGNKYTTVYVVFIPVNTQK